MATCSGDWKPGEKRTSKWSSSAAISTETGGLRDVVFRGTAPASDASVIRDAMPTARARWRLTSWDPCLMTRGTPSPIACSESVAARSSSAARAAHARAFTAGWKARRAFGLGDGGVLLAKDGESHRVEAHPDAGVLVAAATASASSPAATTDGWP